MQNLGANSTFSNQILLSHKYLWSTTLNDFPDNFKSSYCNMKRQILVS